MKKDRTVFVGLSGGVDSGVAAARLKARGYNVVGVFIKVWHPDFMPCHWEAERLDAMRVAAHLEIPFLTCDAEAEYKDEVANYFIDEYKAGRTPNPDVMCNQFVKFGAFLRFAKAHGADYVATGHYAQKKEGENGPELHRGVDVGKDQTYFLWTLSQKQLSDILFPIGDTDKAKIRKEAARLGLLVAQKKDSQGICFLGHVDIADFLSHYVDLRPGAVLNETGEVVGEHKGALIYTLGQRHGFSLRQKDTAQKPMFVTDVDIENNTITVSENRPLIDSRSNILLDRVVLRYPIKTGDKLEAQFRYRQTPFAVEVLSVNDNQITLKVDETTEKPAVGQSCVLYQGSHCLGGGIIS